MPDQLPAVVVVGAPNLTGALSAALLKTHKFPSVHTAATATELLELSADLPDGALVYLFSPTAVVDMDGISLGEIVAQIKGSGHYVMAVGGNPAGDAFASENGLPILRPRTNLVKEIAGVCGIRVDAPAPKPKPRPQEPAPEQNRAAEMQGSVLWRQAKDARDQQARRELAPLPDGEMLWSNAIGDARRAGALLPSHQARGFVIAFAARKGGVGKTTLSVNSAAYLARALAHSGKRVVLIDMNLQQSDVGNYLQKNSPNIVDLVRNPSLLTSDRIEEGLVYSEKHHLWALIGPRSLREANPAHVHLDLYRQIIELLKNRFDYILIDTPVAEHYHEALQVALPAANYIVVPIQPARVTLDDISDWLNQITAPRHANGYGVDSHRVGIILNRAKIGIGLDPEDVEDRLAGWRMLGMFPDSDEWQLAENTGGLIGENPPSDLDAVFRHMLREATNEPELGRPGEVPSKRGKKQKKGGWLRRLLSS